MCITHRPLLPNDLPAALALADRSPLALPHLADWPYRFASWALDEPENAHVWLNDAGQIQGWAVLQTPFWAIDAVVHSEASPSLYREILTWTTKRAQALATANAGRPMWFVSIAAACLGQRQELETHGFIDVSEDDDEPWSKVLFVLPKERVVPSLQLAAGMVIRSLSLPQELEHYVALHRAVFESESMTRAWRQATTHMPGYRNELDLVLVNEIDELCGFCVAWLREQVSGELIGQIEPLGIAESYRGRQLSQALIAEAVRRLREQGVGQIFVETDQQREAAMAAYAAMGFEEAYEVRVYRYDVLKLGI